MTSNDVIEAAARRIYESDQNCGLWEHQSTATQDLFRRNARALAAAGLLIDEIPGPLPDDQVRQSPDGLVWQRINCGEDRPWANTYNDDTATDDDARDWTIITPPVDVDALVAALEHAWWCDEKNRDTLAADIRAALGDKAAP